MTIMFPLFFGISQSAIRLGKMRNLNGAAVKLYLALCHESERKCNREITLTARQADEMVGLHRNSIKKAQKELVEAGLLYADPFGADGHVYQLCDPATGKPWPGSSQAQVKYQKRGADLEKPGEKSEGFSERKLSKSESAGTSFAFGANGIARDEPESDIAVPQQAIGLTWGAIGRR